jgi:3-phenylpropionate/trans-cinnamate dioxygenase ferredoxin reductase subunit
MSELQSIAIIGAGQAGGWVARTLRNEGFSGAIVLIGEEDADPYERPPLSKQVLCGDASPDSAQLWKPDDFAALNIDSRRGVRALAIDRQNRQVSCDDGTVVDYDRLVLATGSRVRRLSLPGSDLPQIHYLRTLADCAALRERLATSRRLLVIGGGWIGLEVAASARKQGLAVTLVEVGERLCGRALPPLLAEHLLRLHRAHGVDLRLGCGVQRFAATGESITAHLDDGEALSVDLVVAGIGIVPNTDLAEAAGLEVDNGIVVDNAGRTSDPLIFACGDATHHDNGYLGRRLRLESWANAQNQAIVAAKALLGQDVRYDDVPWFWSDQYDMNLQTLGVPIQWGETTLRGDSAADAFTAFYLNGDQLEAVIAVNNGRDIKIARRLMEQRKPVTAGELADPGLRLQDLLKR